MTEDWTAVAAALRQQMTASGTTMTDLAARSGVSLTTVRELVHELNTRHRRSRTLSSLSTALGWEPDHLLRTLHGTPPGDPASDDELTCLRNDIDTLKRDVQDLWSRLEAMNDVGGRWTAPGSAAAAPS